MRLGRQPQRLRRPAAAVLLRPSRGSRLSSRPFATSGSGTAEKEKRVVGLAWDLETTGFPPNCEIVQIAVTCADWDDEPHSSFVRYIMPTCKVQRGAFEIHGISKKLLVEKGAVSLAEVVGELTVWLDSTFDDDRRFVWAAHNGKVFDLPVVRRCCAAAGVALPRGLEESANTVDTLTLGRALSAEVCPDGASLGALFQQATGTPLEGAHDALADAKALAKVWVWLVQDQSADPRSAVFEDYLACVYTDVQSKMAAAGNAAAPRKRRSAEELGLDELQSLSGLGPKIDTQLRELGINTVTELVDTIAKARRAGESVTVFAWLKSHLKAHAGALAKLRDALAAPAEREEETPAAALGLAAAVEEVWRTRQEWGPSGLTGLQGKDEADEAALWCALVTQRTNAQHGQTFSEIEVLECLSKLIAT